MAPDHPDFPPTWLTRHYGCLCLGWPGIKPATFNPDTVIRCGYRVWIHRGSPGSAAEVQTVYQGFTSQDQVRWFAPPAAK